jgi:hypothetical protein
MIVVTSIRRCPRRNAFPEFSDVPLKAMSTVYNIHPPNATRNLPGVYPFFKVLWADGQKRRKKCGNRPPFFGRIPTCKNKQSKEVAAP